MLNLKLKEFTSSNHQLLKNVIHVCENLNENFYFAINDRNQIVTINNGEVNVVYELTNEHLNQINSNLNEELNDNKCDNKSDNKLIAFGHLPDLELLCLIYENGSICTISLEREQFDKIQIDYRLVTADFSPEYDKIVLTTDTKLILLNSFFEEINLNDLNDQKEGAIDHLNVGWGKKETQFHGSEGKQARTIKKELITCDESDDLKPYITWRDDGVFFATSVVDPTKLIRKIRIYDNEGILQQSSEEESGLEHQLSWKPNSNLIAASVTLNTGHSIMLYERNGQRFDSFNLPYKKNEFLIKQFIWSNVSDCLMIFGLEKQTNKEIVLIYTQKNFHWYCKQKLIFDNQIDKRRISKIINQNQLTNEFQPLNLKILFDDGTLREYVYLNQVNATENGNCAVIDGRQLLITPFQFATIPPPMYAYSLEFETQVNEVCFSQPSGKYALVKLSNKSLHLIELANELKLHSTVKVCFKQIAFKQPNRPLIYTKSLKCLEADKVPRLEDFNQFSLTDELICYAFSSLKNELLVLDLKDDKSTIIDLNEDNNKSISIELICLNNQNTLILVDKNGLVWKLKSCMNEHRINEFKVTNFKTSELEQVRLRTPIDSIVKIVALEEKILTLYSNYSLHINHLPVQGNDCNSFLIYDSNCLMYTTNDHHLRSIWLDDIFYYFETFDLPDYDNENQFRFVLDNGNDKLVRENILLDKQPNSSAKHPFNSSNKEMCRLQPIDRSVERGSRLVTSSSLDCKLIIQMPRGNLEIITPRLLVLDRFKFLLNTLQYWSAFQLIKKHRINLNLIVDFDQTSFLNNAMNFIEQMSEESSLDDLNLFLSDLSKTNVLDTLYASYNKVLRNQVGNNKSTSLFETRFPELSASVFSANLGGDKDCLDGKRIYLGNDLAKDKKYGDLKLEKVCQKLREAMLELDEKKYFIPILLTYLKQGNQSIGTALIKIYEQTDKNLKTRALNYLKWIIDINILIKEALSTYDLGIARMVYSVSNQDPKEYLPLISKFESYKLNEYRNYEIDLHLKNYDKALKNLTLCEPFSEYAKKTIDLIEQKHLYETAIKLFSNNAVFSQYLNQTYSLYGDYLLIKKYFNEALIMFKKGKNYQNAIKAAQLSNDWNQVIECSALAYTQLKNDKSVDENDRLNLLKLYETVAEQLQNNPQNAKDSAFIYGVYLGNWNEAIRVLVKNNEWASVYRILNDEFLNDKNENANSIGLNRTDIDKLLELADNGLKRHHQVIVDQLNDSLNELRAYTERLQKVRENKLNLMNTMNQADNLNDLEDEFLNDESTVSTVNSIQSGKRRLLRSNNRSNQSQTNSLKTNKAARRMRKNNRNQYRLKEGSRDEDLALIYRIKKEIKSIEKLKTIIKLLISSLTNRNFDDLASNLQSQFSKLLEVVKFVISIVWPDDLLNENRNEFSSLLNNEMNVNAIQDVRLQNQPKTVDVDWKLVFFEDNVKNN